LRFSSEEKITEIGSSVLNSTTTAVTGIVLRFLPFDLPDPRVHRSASDGGVIEVRLRAVDRRLIRFDLRLQRATVARCASSICVAIAFCARDL